MITQAARDQIIRRLDEAEGFLMLEMPLRALEILQSRPNWATMQFEASFLTGEAQRQLGDVREALPHLERASRLKPGHLGVAIALGWCYKRTHRLAQAIDALEQALRLDPEEPLLHYNLACYWSLANNPKRALEALIAALEREPDLHSKLADEADFEPLRGHPAFDRLISDQGASTF